MCFYLEERRFRYCAPQSSPPSKKVRPPHRDSRGRRNAIPNLETLLEQQQRHLSTLSPPSPPSPDCLDIHVATCDFRLRPTHVLIGRNKRLLILGRDENGWSEAIDTVGNIGWIPTSHVARIETGLEKYMWFHPDIMQHDQAERILSTTVSGSFLAWKNPHGHYLSLRADDHVEHHNLQMPNRKYSLAKGTMFDTLPELVAYYSKQSDGLLLFPVLNKCKS